MTITLPESDGLSPGAAASGLTSGRGFAAAHPAGVAARDFGESLVRPIDAVQQAAELCQVDCSLHDATRTFNAFTENLTAADDDFEAWPDRFAAEAKRVRDEFAGRIPDGPSRDRFDAGFDLFAKAKAVETRGLATHKRIATNRAELDRALTGYADSISRAMNPVSVEFALSQGDVAIRNQVAAKVLSEDEGAALSQRYRADIATRRARQFTDDDPEEAARELRKDKDGLFDDLDPADRKALAGNADRAAAAQKFDRDRAQEAEERRIAAQSALRRDAFLRDLDTRTENGVATLSDIAAAARDGILEPNEADTRLRALEISFADRLKAGKRVSDLMSRPGVRLNPNALEDQRAAEIHWNDTVAPLVADMPADRRAEFEDSVVYGTGIVPKPLADQLRGGLLSGDPALRVQSARRIHRWLLSQPPIPVDASGLRIRELESVRPYLDLPLSDARIIDLAEDAVMHLEPGEEPLRIKLLGAEAGEAPAETDNADGGEAAVAQPPGLPDPDAGSDAGSGATSAEKAQDRLEEKLADPETRAALREQLLKDLEAEAEKSGLSPSEILERQQKIRDALPADPAKGTRVAVAPLAVAGGAAAARMLLSPGALSAALTAIGLGGFAGSEPGGLLPPGQGAESSDGNTTSDSIQNRTDETDSDGGQGRGRSEDDDVSGGSGSGDPGDEPPDQPRRGKKARDSSKNERHGDRGRALGKAKRKFEGLDQQIRNAPNKKTRKRLKTKKKRMEETAIRKRRGVEHGIKEKR